MTIKERIVKELQNELEKRITKVMLRNRLKVNSENQEEFNIAIRELLNEGIVVVTKKKKLQINNSYEIFIGKFIFHSKGYGFCILTERPPTPNALKEVFIPPSLTKNTLNGDRVIVRINKDVAHDKKAEGEVISILERNLTNLVGTYMDNGSFGFVIPDNTKINMDIYIPQDMNLGAQSYDKVLVKITKYPEGDRKPEGIIEEVLGFKGEQGVDFLSVIAEYDINPEFPAKVLAQVDKMPEEIEEREINRRKDLTNLNIFTIDGEDAKDLDDAISIKKLSNGNYRLGVHIADVAHYVREGSRVDKEALERGTSVYLINKVIPMLPKKLSNGLCSLNAGEIKLTLSVVMEINSNGSVVKHKIFESFIKSKAKLCYNEVSDFLEGKSTEFAEKYPFLVEDIKIAQELQGILEKKRFKRGAIEFNFAEAKIVLDEEESPLYIGKYDRRISNKIIEEFMLIANETVSEHFYNLGIPFVYRIHEDPREERIQEFYTFIQNYGYIVPMEISPQALQEILIQAKDKPEENAINLLMLQSMQQARYYPEPKGHFGLGCKFYSHFTSPIRRYPDLQIHRIIKEYLNGQLNEVRRKQLEKTVEFSSKLSSKRERIAQNAEMDYDNIKKIEFIQKHIGDEFIGMITGITTTGMYITLDNTIEGFLHIDKIPNDLFVLVREECKFEGHKSGQIIMLGDKVKVKVFKASIDTKEVIFNFVEFIK